MVEELLLIKISFISMGLLTILSFCGGFALGLLVGIDNERYKKKQSP